MLAAVGLPDSYYLLAANNIFCGRDNLRLFVVGSQCPRRALRVSAQLFITNYQDLMP